MNSMNEAYQARKKSDEMFQIHYASEIKYIKGEIDKLAFEGFRSVWIESSPEWVGEQIAQTQRLIEHLKEQGFGVDAITVADNVVSMWNDACKGIVVNW